MARKNYSEDFRRQAIDLYLNTPGATFKAIAADLAIGTRGTLQNWVYAQHPAQHPTPAPATHATGTSPKGESAAARIARLETALAAEQDERRNLETQRDILRQAAKYFAGETNW
ncbi:transposase [Nocardiopsis salina]|uniref:transposase n=1 Tax=Nocardiopsis salina TaxID=245836 RepID=UPI000348A01A|nr:transposase [Nocardiopsis salina]